MLNKNIYKTKLRSIQKGCRDLNIMHTSQVNQLKKQYITMA